MPEINTAVWQTVAVASHYFDHLTLLVRLQILTDRVSVRSVEVVPQCDICQKIAFER